MKPQCDLVWDESGTLLDGVFYQFEVQFDESCVDEDCDETWIVVNRDDPEGYPDTAWLWVETFPQEHAPYVEYRYECPASKKHPTRRFVNPKVYAELYGGKLLTEFIPNSARDEYVVSNVFAERLRETGLRGLQFVPLALRESEALRKKFEYPALSVLEFSGRILVRPLKVVGKPNVCPFCGTGPLICPTCGYWPYRCFSCNQNNLASWRTHPGGDDKRLTFPGLPKAGTIVQGASWDGSDFVQAYLKRFITKRALNWLLSVHAKPFYVRPARVLVDGMSAEQKEWLRQAQEPIVKGMM